MLVRHEKTVSDRSDTNHAVQPQKMISGLKIWIKKIEGLYFLCSENKGALTHLCNMLILTTSFRAVK